MATDSQTAPSGAAPAKATARGSFRMLPLAMILVVVAGNTALAFTDYDRDVRMVSGILSSCLVVVCLGIWVIVATAWPAWLRWGLCFAPWVLALSVIGLFEIEHDGDMAFLGIRWRGTPRDSDLAVPHGSAEAVAAATGSWAETPLDFPRFLGPNGDGILANTRLDSNWKDHPPELQWKQPIGAGWSGFAVVGNYAITQEQRGSTELVVCYEVATGQVVWSHQNKLRFDPRDVGALGGIGPRATPTIYDKKVYTQGATGIVNCLNAATGELQWSVDTLERFDGDNVAWGKAGSPLIVDDRVVISVGGRNDHSLVALAQDDGEVIWHAGKRQASYATPVLGTLLGKQQIVVVNQDFVTAHDAETGGQLWEVKWPGNSDSDASVSNVTIVAEDRVLLSKGYGVGAQLVQLTVGPSGNYSTKVLWKKTVLKTKMTNSIVQGKYAYGLNGGILQCVEWETGKQRWKKGRFGHGQVLLVGDHLLVTTEKGGKVVLVQASPEKFVQLAEFQALEKGAKTWNYPAVAGEFLLVRNAEQAACWKLRLESAESLSVALPQVE